MAGYIDFSCSRILLHGEVIPLCIFTVFLLSELFLKLCDLHANQAKHVHTCKQAWLDIPFPFICFRFHRNLFTDLLYCPLSNVNTLTLFGVETNFVLLYLTWSLSSLALRLLPILSQVDHFSIFTCFETVEKGHSA